jgi:hypothetical protein
MLLSRHRADIWHNGRSTLSGCSNIREKYVCVPEDAVSAPLSAFCTRAPRNNRAGRLIAKRILQLNLFSLCAAAEKALSPDVPAAACGVCVCSLKRHALVDGCK